MKNLTRPTREKARKPASWVEIMDSLRTIELRELHQSIVDLGLVHGLELTPDRCTVRMVLTSPRSKDRPRIVDAVRQRVKAVTGLKDVKVKLVWDPPWDPAEDALENVLFTPQTG